MRNSGGDRRIPGNVAVLRFIDSGYQGVASVANPKSVRHCEERSDEAIQGNGTAMALDCFAFGSQ